MKRIVVNPQTRKPKLFLSILVMFLVFGSLSVQAQQNTNTQAPIKLFDSFELTKRENIAPVYLPYVNVANVKLNSQLFDLKSANVGDKTEMQLFDGIVLQSTIDRVSVNVNNTLTVRSRTDNYETGYMILTITNGSVFAKIEIPQLNKMYVIQNNTKAGTCYVLDIDKTKLKETILEDGVGIVSQEEVSEKITTVTADSKSVADIDIMVLYTTAAKAWADGLGYNIANIIAQAVATTQLAFDNSLLLMNLTMVYSQEIAYTESGSDVDVTRLAFTSDGYMDDIHQMRDDYGADFVSMLTFTDDVGGLGYLLNNYNGSANTAFNVCRVQQVSYGYSFMHELGHNMGADHNEFQMASPGPNVWINWPETNEWTAGWRWLGSDNNMYCDIMTYESGFYFPDGIDAARIPYFSNPNVSYLGGPTGHPLYGDNVRSMNEIRNTLAAYRRKALVCTPPTIQASNLVVSDVQNNQMTLSWTRGSGNSALVLARLAYDTDIAPWNGTDYVANSAFGSGDLVGNGAYVVYDGTETSFTLTNLGEGRIYRFAVYEFDSSTKCYTAAPIAVTEPLRGSGATTGESTCSYCSPLCTGNDMTGFTYIHFYTISNSSNTNGFYSDFTNKTASVIRGNTYPLSIQVNTAGNFLVYATAWFDWDKSCTFDDSEAYDLGTAKNVTNGGTSLSPLPITIPQTAVPGNIRMRIRVVYDHAALPCADQHFSEAEDYTIIVPNFVGTETVQNNAYAYPNPVTNVLNLENIEHNATLALYDITGKQVYSQLNTNNQINTSALKGGMYYLKITEKSATKTLKIVKQ